MYMYMNDYVEYPVHIRYIYKYMYIVTYNVSLKWDIALVSRRYFSIDDQIKFIIWKPTDFCDFSDLNASVRIYIIR